MKKIRWGAWVEWVTVMIGVTMVLTIVSCEPPRVYDEDTGKLEVVEDKRFRLLRKELVDENNCQIMMYVVKDTETDREFVIVRKECQIIDLGVVKRTKEEEEW